ncbi:MAG: sporulation integral membrane protein YtvI [Desulfitobacteriaceae bacterium]|nr:sporulation integral membrane protein YtvI [Desulfitobacteriaceae bacterium]MDD4345787.1 sporulation integral membrane protein YtvI [Desulfitobacteriaceae bacterium]MDD4401473.1 sporulation integral membrane protein YtvI [Desulfitobacteriaceae bacterium]
MGDFIKKLLIILVTIISIILIPLFIYYVLPHFMPFIIALFFALLLEPLIQQFMSRLKIKRLAAANLAYFLFLGLLGLFGYTVIVKIVTEIFDLIRNIQVNIPQIQNWVLYLYLQTQDFIRLLPPEIAVQINNACTNFINQLSNLNLITAVGGTAYDIGKAIPNFFFSTLLFLISLYLISLNLINIQDKFYSYFKSSSKVKISKVLTDLKFATIGFIQAQIILSSITFIVSLAGLLILHVKYASAIALVIVLVDMLPILGTGAVLIPWAVFSLVTGKTFLAVGLVILYIVITIIRRIIEPKILGDRIGLGPLSTLISIWVGFKVLGILGVFIVPLLLILAKALVKAEVIQSKIKI